MGLLLIVVSLLIVLYCPKSFKCMGAVIHQLTDGLSFTEWQKRTEEDNQLQEYEPDIVWILQWDPNRQ